MRFESWLRTITDAAAQKRREAADKGNFEEAEEYRKIESGGEKVIDAYKKGVLTEQEWEMALGLGKRAKEKI